MAQPNAVAQKPLHVLKFGGTSVGTTERIVNVAKRVAEYIEGGYRVVVVVSAMSGETNRLTDLAKEISRKPSAREFDVLLSTGEQVTIALLSMALQEMGYQAKSYLGDQVKIKTDQSYGKARIESIDSDNMLSAFNDYQALVVAGFQGVDELGNITTLGRGGSDTTAVALAAALNANECEIFTDVDGVYTTDPRIEPNARKLNHITFEEMLEMASLGSKVLQIRSVEFAGKYQVPLRVRSTFDHSEGTLICVDDESKDKIMENPVISGIAFSKDEAKITVRDVPDTPGVAYQILGVVGEANIEVDMIVQNVSAAGTTDFTFTVARGDLEKAVSVLEQNEDIKEKIHTDNQIVKVSLVGVGMRSHAGVASKMFKILSDEKINIQMISTSEIKISAVIDEKYLELAVRALHEGFELAKTN